MKADYMRMSLKDRFAHVFAIVSGERFLKKQGLGNEVPFFICPYAPQEALEVDKHGKSLIKKLETANVRVLKINLYDLSVEVLKSRDIWDRIREMEASVSKTELKELLQGVLDPAEHLVPAIAARLAAQPHDVIFISGVGEVFPYIRSHNVLNNLQSTAKDKPTVMFFPGEYTHSPESGASLDLFGRLHDDKYYRAFNIFHCEA
jgi:hypothetical protein